MTWSLLRTPTGSTAVEHAALVRESDTVISRHASYPEACARVAELEAERSKYDCRFVGRYAELAGIHCPHGDPCQRCQLDAAEAERDRLRDAVRDAMSYANGRWCEWGERAEAVRDRLLATLEQEGK